MLLLIVALTLLPAATEGSEVVAMVLNVQGDVKLRRMDLLRAGAEVHVPASGSVRLVFLADGHREQLNPGAKVKLTELGGTPPGAVKREKTNLPANQLDGLRSLAASARAGVSRVRGVGAPPLPAAPVAASIVLSDRPDFAWFPVGDAKPYEIQLFGGETVRQDSVIWSATAARAHLEYPKNRPALERGGTYTWTVTAREAGAVAKGTFAVATKDQVGDFEPVCKLSRSPEKSDRLLAAMLFEAGQVFGDSHRIFESLAKEMPTEPWVIMASARHLARMGRMEEATAREAGHRAPGAALRRRQRGTGLGRSSRWPTSRALAQNVDVAGIPRPYPGRTPHAARDAPAAANC